MIWPATRHMFSPVSSCWEIQLKVIASFSSASDVWAASPDRYSCWSPNLASTQTGKYCNSNRLALPYSPKFGIIPANEHVLLPHMWLQTLCQQLLGTGPIAKLSVCLPASMPRSCYVVVACLVSACCRRDIKAGGLTPSCWLLSVSTAPLSVVLQMFNEGVTLPSYSQTCKARLKMGTELLKLCVHGHILDMDCVYMDIYQATESKFQVQTCVWSLQATDDVVALTICAAIPSSQ